MTNWLLLVCISIQGGGCSYRNSATAVYVTETHCRAVLAIPTSRQVLCLSPDGSLITGR